MRLRGGFNEEYSEKLLLFETTITKGAQKVLGFRTFVKCSEKCFKALKFHTRLFYQAGLFSITKTSNKLTHHLIMTYKTHGLFQRSTWTSCLWNTCRPLKHISKSWFQGIHSSYIICHGFNDSLAWGVWNRCNSTIAFELINFCTKEEGFTLDVRILGLLVSSYWTIPRERCLQHLEENSQQQLRNSELATSGASSSNITWQF